MNSVSRTPKNHLLYCLCVMLLCVIPAAGMLFRPTTQPIGNSSLAEWPSLTAQDGSFNENIPEDIGSYFEDRFAFRAEMISADSLLRSGIFGVSSQDSVIVGTDGWLYYEATLDDFMHRNSVSERTLINEARNMALMQEYTELLGKQFLFIIAPNKNSLYGENMPSRYRYTFAENSDAERLIPYLEAEGVHYVDLYGLFRNMDGIHYYRRDSHWDETGAVAVYNALLDAAGISHETYAEVTPGETSDYTGDLAAMLYPSSDIGPAPETRLHYLADPSYEMLDGASSVEENLIRTANSSGSGRLLMYRDSFGNSLLPYMAQNFEAATFSKIVPYPMTDLVNESPDLVIVEKVERHLPTLASVPPAMNSPERLPEQMTSELSSAEKVSFSDLGITAPEISAVSSGWQITGSLTSADGTSPVRENGRIYLEITGSSENTFYVEPFYVTLGSDDRRYQADISQFRMAEEPVSVAVIAETESGPIILK